MAVWRSGEVGSTISRTLLDTKNTSMYLFLEGIAKSRDELVRGSFIQKWSGLGARATKDQVAVWRTLKGLTGGMVKTIVMSVGSCHGVCHKHRRETLELLTEMERRMKMVRDLTDQGVSDMHARSVLIGIFDPMTRQHTANKLSESFEVFKKQRCWSLRMRRACRQKDASKLDAMQVESVAGPAQCAGVQYKSPCVSAVKHVEVAVIWKGRTFGLSGHMLVATTVGEKGTSPGIVPQKGWENEAFQGKGLHWEKGSAKVESLLLISFPKEEENLARAARALGRNQQEVAGFVADNTTQKNVQKDK